jgi:hypothetical protein
VRPGLNISLARLERLRGHEAARRTYAAVTAAVDEIGRVAADEGLGIDWRRGGEITLARGSHERPALDHALRELERFGLADGLDLLEGPRLAARVSVSKGVAGLFTPGRMAGYSIDSAYGARAGFASPGS